MADKINTTPLGDEFDIKCFEVAFNYVNICAGSKTEAYRRWIMEHNENIPALNSLGKCAYEFFKHKKVQEYIEQFREENRKANEDLRDSNMAILKSIAVDNLACNRDKIAAIKELNQMCGFNTPKKVEVSSKELVVEIDGK